MRNKLRVKTYFIGFTRSSLLRIRPAPSHHLFPLRPLRRYQGSDDAHAGATRAPARYALESATSGVHGADPIIPRAPMVNLKPKPATSNVEMTAKTARPVSGTAASAVTSTTSSANPASKIAMKLLKPHDILALQTSAKSGKRQSVYVPAKSAEIHGIPVKEALVAVYSVRWYVCSGRARARWG